MLPSVSLLYWQKSTNTDAAEAPPAFRSDGLKLYPTLVIRGTGLYELWKTGRYRNYSPELLIDLVAHILALVPPWTRIYRIQRDIPMPLVTAGVEHGNLRELALARMKELGLRCRDVRTFILLYMCPHATISVLVLLYVYPHTTMYVCSLILLGVETCAHEKSAFKKSTKASARNRWS